MGDSKRVFTSMRATVSGPTKGLRVSTFAILAGLRPAVTVELVGSHAPASESKTVYFGRLESGIEEIGQFLTGNIQWIGFNVEESCEGLIHGSVLSEFKKTCAPDKGHVAREVGIDLCDIFSVRPFPV